MVVAPAKILGDHIIAEVFVTGYFSCRRLRRGNGRRRVALRFVRVPPSIKGLALSRKERIQTSDENGLVEFTNLIPGATYEGRRGEGGGWLPFTIPSDAESPLALDSIWGLDL